MSSPTSADAHTSHERSCLRTIASRPTMPAASPHASITTLRNGMTAVWYCAMTPDTPSVIAITAKVANATNSHTASHPLGTFRLEAGAVSSQGSAHLIRHGSAVFASRGVRR